jgi:hypothetical protein
MPQSEQIWKRYSDKIKRKIIEIDAYNNSFATKLRFFEEAERTLAGKICKASTLTPIGH